MAPSIPTVKIIIPILRILIVLLRIPLIPANKPANAKRTQYRTVGMGKTFSPSIPISQKTKGIATNEKQSVIRKHLSSLESVHEECMDDILLAIWNHIEKIRR